jgi:hypothetical protein
MRILGPWKPVVLVWGLLSGIGPAVKGCVLLSREFGSSENPTD